MWKRCIDAADSVRWQPTYSDKKKQMKIQLIDQEQVRYWSVEAREKAGMQHCAKARLPGSSELTGCSGSNISAGTHLP